MLVYTCVGCTNVPSPRAALHTLTSMACNPPSPLPCPMQVKTKRRTREENIIRSS